MTLTVAPIGVNTERELPVDFLLGISVFSWCRLDLLCAFCLFTQRCVLREKCKCLFWGLCSGQSSSTDSLRAKKYFLRSSVIYSESRRVRDGLPPPPTLHPPSVFTRLSSSQYVCVCVCVCVPLSRRHTCISPPLPRCTLCRGEAMTTESEREVERGLADYLTFPSCPPCLQAWVGGRGGGLGLSLQLRFCSASLLRWLNGARISKPTGDKWPTSLPMSFQYNLGINYTNWYCTVINIHLCCGLHAGRCVCVCVDFVGCITREADREVLAVHRNTVEWFHL